MISKYVSLPVFLLSLAVGILCVYLWGEDQKVIYVFPTPTNVNELQYKHHNGTCYSYKYQKVDCDINSKETPLE